MKRTYRYRLYPKDKQKVRLFFLLTLCRQLYNAALNERILAHDRGVNINYNHQSKELPMLKEIFPEYKGVLAQSLQDVLHRLDKAYKNYFRRCKERAGGKKVDVGFPRFKSRYRFRSFTYPQTGFKILDKTHLQVTKIGILRFFQHRPIPKGGVIKTMTIKVDRVGDWWVTFSVELPDAKPVKARTAVGVDVGCKTLAHVSDGEVFERMRFMKAAADRVKRLQRKLARCKRGSNRRAKVRTRLARAHRKVARQREDYIHKVSNVLVQNYDVIAFEKLNIKNMVKNHCLAGSILDAAWGKLIEFTRYKAESAGKTVELVDPCGTTCTCHVCGCKVEMTLSDRTFSCPECGVVLDRDLNAGLNIRRRLGPGWAELLNKAHRAGATVPDLMSGVSTCDEVGSPCL